MTTPSSAGRPRLLHIVGDSEFGGGSRLVLRFAERAMQEGWAVDVLATAPRFITALEASGVGVVPLEVIWRPVRPLRDAIGLARLAAFLRRTDYTLVHTHTSKAGFVGRIAARLAGVPAVLHTVHGFGFHAESSSMATTAYTALERLAARSCDAVVTVSDHLRDVALARGIGRPDSVHAIPNGIADHAASPGCRERLRAEFGAEPDDIVFLAVGRLGTQKGLPYLLDAAAKLQQRGVARFRVVIAGEGPLEEALRARTQELGLYRRITFLGFRSDARDLLDAADVVVLPSLWEGLSIALLEAIAAGRPVVATSIPANTEVVRHGREAWLVPPKDDDALADGMAHVMRQPITRAALGGAARERFLDHYTEERMLDRYMALYEALAVRSGASTLRSAA